MEERSPTDDIIAEHAATLDDLMYYYCNLHHASLVCLDPDEYFRRQLDSQPFKEPKDKSKQRAARDAGITWALRVKAYLPWDTESRSELEKRTHQAEALQREYEKEHTKNVEDERALYQRQQDRHNQRVNGKKRSFLNGNPGGIMAYFDQVLSSDVFTLELNLNRRGRNYESYARSLEYDRDKKNLVVRYRIPNQGEICTIGSFVDNKEERTVEAKELPVKKAAELRMHVLHAILIRTSAEIFYSDPYSLISRLTIVGFLDFYDPAYGKGRVTDVIRTTISEKEFCQVDLGRADPEALFGKLYKTTIAAGLYKKEPYQLKAV